MKRTNKKEEVERLSSRLPPIPKSQLRYIRKQFMNDGYAFSGNKGEIYCSCCGKVSYTRTIPYVCPQCGKRITMTYDKYRVSYNGARRVNHSNIDYFYHTVYTTCKGWQVIRTYYCKRYTEKAKQEMYSLHEVCQWWIDGDGKSYVMGAAASINPYNDYWAIYSPLRMKKSRANRYYVAGQNSPDVRIIPELKRNGLTKEMLTECSNPISLIEKLLTCNSLETFIKSEQKELINYCLQNDKLNIESLLPVHVLNICSRNHYIIKAPKMYIDYIKLLVRFNLDTHNAHYVCPANLKEAYDTLEQRELRERVRIQREKELENIQMNEGKYADMKANFLNIRFGNGTLNLHVLQSVKEFHEEGEAMHHCVYQCGYYNKKDSLILSCRGADGKRIETIEVNLANFSITQSRGVCNSVTEFHDEIVQLVKNNMYLIREAAKLGVGELQAA